MELFELKYVSVEIADLVATVTMDDPPVNAQTDEDPGRAYLRAGLPLGP